MSESTSIDLKSQYTALVDHQNEFKQALWETIPLAYRTIMIMFVIKLTEDEEIRDLSSIKHPGVYETLANFDEENNKAYLQINTDGPAALTITLTQDGLLTFKIKNHHYFLTVSMQVSMTNTGIKIDPASIKLHQDPAFKSPIHIDIYAKSMWFWTVDNLIKEINPKDTTIVEAPWLLPGRAGSMFFMSNNELLTIEQIGKYAFQCSFKEGTGIKDWHYDSLSIFAADKHVDVEQCQRLIAHRLKVDHRHVGVSHIDDENKILLIGVVSESLDKAIEDLKESSKNLTSEE